MRHTNKTRQQRVKELKKPRARAAALKQSKVERKRAEEALRESEGRFRLLYEKAPLGYQSLDAAGYFIDVNQAWLDTLGYSREEVIGRWFGDFLAPHEVEPFKQRFPKFKATGEVQVEVEMVRKDGAPQSLLLSAGLHTTNTEVSSRPTVS
jgi:PAS domain S-box-containing protein